MTGRYLATHGRAIALVTIVTTLGCAGARPRGIGPLPPEELLRQDLARASLVVTIEVQRVTPVKEFVDDQGTVGYVQYSVTGEVVEVFKQEIPCLSTISYSFTAEQSTGGDAWPVEGDELLVFLEPAPPGDALWLIDEAAQFPVVEKLPRLMRKLAEQSR